jgi:ABC-type polysaccharide/polyol phosphate transport system, ATPase component
VALRGRVGALIALGSGFNPILTGLENIYINGSVMGLSRQEIDEKMDEIIGFSGIGEFINTPVQNYSSGMSVRLGFGIASALNPDILLVDEVLAVGDAAFKVRCYNKIKELLPSAAVILVSHSMFDISRTATQVSVMDKGREVFHGSVEAGVHLYNELNNEEISLGDSTKIVTHADKGISGVNVKKFEHETSGLSTNLVLEFGCESATDVGPARIRLVFFDISQTPIAEWDSAHHGISYVLRVGPNNYSVEINNIRLVSGFYRVAVVLADEKTTDTGQGLNMVLICKSTPWP